LRTTCFCPLSCVILVLRCHELQVLQQERSVRGLTLLQHLTVERLQDQQVIRPSKP
jgi:hypothetical protein